MYFCITLLPSDYLEAEIRKLQQENDSLKRQIDLLKSQALIAENAKRRTDDKIRKFL